MSAGTGVTHSEFNPSPDEPVHFLQIWILPRERGLTPSYTEWHPKPEHADAAKVLVISPDGRDGSATIHQDADIYRIRLKPGEAVTHQLRRGLDRPRSARDTDGQLRQRQHAAGGDQPRRHG